MNKMTVIYARISREDGDKINENTPSKSIDNQVKMVRDYAQKRGYTIDKIYVDDGFSGGHFSRPNFQLLLADMRAGKIDSLFVKDISRIGRVMYRVGEYIERIFPYYGVKVFCVEDNYIGENKTDFFDENIVVRNFLNDYYLKEFKRKIRVVKYHQATTIHLNYYPKFGYIFDQDKRERIDTYSAEIVRKIFRLVAEDCLSTCRVAKILNGAHIPTRAYYATHVLGLKSLSKNPKNVWTGAKVWEIVKDYEYCGHSVNLVRKKEERIILKNTHLAIIDEVLYWRAQTVIQSHSTRKKSVSHIGKILVDKENGTHLLYAKNRGKPYYFLRRNNIQSYKIDGKTIEWILANDAVALFYKENGKGVKTVLKERLQDINGENNRIKLEQLNKKYLLLLEGFFAGKVLKEVFKRQSNDLREKIEALEGALKNEEEIDLKIDTLYQKLLRYLNGLDGKQIVKLLIKTVELERTGEGGYNLMVRYK